MRLFLTLLAFFLTYGSLMWAQPAGAQGEANATSLAFIKDKTRPFPADSLTLSTSLDPDPYGFPFRQDTMILDVTIFPPIDELIIELFAGSQSLGKSFFWADAPSANVHLSVKEKQTQVDSVTLSGVDTWYREQLLELQQSKGLLALSRKLEELANLTSDNLMGITFASALVDLPNVTSGQLYALREGTLPYMSFLLKQHPRYRKLKETVRMLGRKPGNFKTLGFYNANGKAVKIKLPQTFDYYVLDLYSADNSAAKVAHQQIRDTPMLDSLFTQVVPIISISNDSSPALWRLYVNDNDFRWNHFVEDPEQPERLSAEIPVGQRPLYLLINRKGRVDGVYFRLSSLVNAVRFRTRD